MNDRDFLHEAFASCRGAEPTPDEVARVVQAARSPTRRAHVRLVPRLAPLAASLMLAAALVVPTSRAALAAGVDELRSFLGGGPSPGRELVNSEEKLLAQIEGASRDRSRVLARDGDEVLAAYRDARSGGACVVFGLHGRSCFLAGDLQPRFLGGSVAPLFLAPTDDGAILWGVTSSEVAAIDISYPDGSVYRATVGESGFIAHLPPINRTPTELVARDRSDMVVARGPLEPDLGWGA